MSMSGGGVGGGDAGGTAGGDAGGSASMTLIACEGKTGWQPLASLPTGAQQESAVAILNGEIFLVGGYDATPLMLTRVLAYSPSTNTWREAAGLPKQMHHVNLASYAGKLYALGGLGQGFGALSDTYSYDPSTNAWSALAPMPTGSDRGACGVAVVDDRIVLVGGYRMGGSVDTVSAYVPATNTWETLPVLPVRKDHLVTVSVGDTIYAIGGRNSVIDGRVDALKLDGGWQPRAAMMTPRAGSSGAVVNGTVIVSGGEGNSAVPSGVFPQTERYDPVANSWSSEPAMRTPRHGTGAAGFGDTFVVPGGANKQGFGAVSTVEALCPP